MCGRKRPEVAMATKGFFLCDGIATLQIVFVNWKKVYPSNQCFTYNTTDLRFIG